MLASSGMFARLKDRPWLAALLLGLGVQLLFAFHLGRPSVLSFDEAHYVPAARMLLALAGPTNLEHPLLGKLLIGLSIALFGDNPVGWRALGTIAGTATVLATFALLWMLRRDVRIAMIGGVLVALNQMVFVQARTGMLDVYLGAFLLWSIALFTWAMRAPAGATLWRWTLASALLGLATAVKWAAAPYVTLAALAFLLLRRGDATRWPGLRSLPALALLGGVSVTTYFVTFLPAFFYSDRPMTLAGLLPLQWEMYQLQTQILAPHPYQAAWWSWPLLMRPIWYFYQPDLGAVRRGVLLIGNPMIMWGGLAAVAACYVAWWRDKARLPLAMALLWTGSLALWALIPKSLGFYYYYYLPGIFLCLTIPLALDHFDRSRDKGWNTWFLVAATAMFVFFYPVLAGAALDDTNAFERWTWFYSWR